MAEDVQEWPHRGLVAQWQICRGDPHGHAGGRQDAAKGRGAGPPTHDDGHPRPRHALQEVRPTHRVGRELGLLGDRPHLMNLDHSRTLGPLRRPVRRAAKDPDVSGDGPGRGSHGRVTAVIGAQHVSGPLPEL